MEILRKMTIKTCGNFSIARIKEVMAAANLEEGQAVPLLKITGTTTGAKTGQTDKGQFTKLLGEFVGVDLTTGALYRSQQCILPEFLGGVLGSALTQGQSVRFAFEIGAKRKDNAITGYEFSIKPLIDTRPTDGMAELMALAGIKMPDAPALPAPDAPAAPAAPADPAPAPDKTAKGSKGGK